MNPIVSVIVATYKRDTSLQLALESLLGQTFEQYEIIVVDDNACEEWNLKVSAIIKQAREQFPECEIKHIKNEQNQGSAKTRNIGIEAARGTYITFLDDDDVYLPLKIQNQVEFMQKGNYDYSITDLNLYNEQDKLIDQRVRSYIKNTSKDSLLKCHLKYHLTGTDAMMFRKEYLVRIGGFAPIDVGDEFYLMQRAIDGDGKFGYLAGCDIKAYVHTGEGGLSSGEGKIKGENALFEYKQKYFSQLQSKDRRYIRMRHYAVLAFAELRRKNAMAFIKDALLSFLNAPIACLVALLRGFN